jgi:hypothetical protein
VASTAVNEVEDWIGAGTLDGQAILDVLARFDDDVLASARSILRQRRATLIASAAELDVDQDYARKIAEWQIAALEGDIAKIDQEIAAGAGEPDPEALPTVGVGRLVRRCPGR